MQLSNVTLASTAKWSCKRPRHRNKESPTTRNNRRKFVLSFKNISQSKGDIPLSKSYPWKLVDIRTWSAKLIQFENDAKKYPENDTIVSLTEKSLSGYGRIEIKLAPEHKLQTHSEQLYINEENLLTRCKAATKNCIGRHKQKTICRQVATEERNGRVIAAKPNEQASCTFSNTPQHDHNTLTSASGPTQLRESKLFRIEAER